jgi:hypothetical protein
MPRLRKFVIACHRWLGTAFCLLFAMWFVSGIAMMYWDYPEIGDALRLAHSAPLDPAAIRISPAAAFAALNAGQAPDDVRLAMLDGRPAYRFRFGGDELIEYADNGQMQEEVTREQALRLASAWESQPAEAARFEGVIREPDQWTVSGEFANLRPLYKFSWPGGDAVYVSSVSPEVVQATTRASRLGAYFGAIPHWMYFTPLRKNGRLWSKTVIWASGAGVVASLLGIAVAIWIAVPAARIPYGGWKRWHTILGLVFGLFACTWAFSGMLSMDPFGWEEGPQLRAEEAALRGAPWKAEPFAERSPSAALAMARPGIEGPVKELELAYFDSDPVYIAHGDASSFVIPVNGAVTAQFDSAGIADIMARASHGTFAEAREVLQYEPYYIDRHNRLPLPALLVELNDPDASRFYIDLKTARIVRSYANARMSRWNRWLYHGLHSMDLPWLYAHRPAWDILMLALLLGGSALSFSSIVLAWRFVGRKIYTRG